MKRLLVVGTLAVAVFAAGGLLGARAGSHHPSAGGARIAPARSTVDLLAASIDRAQQRLHDVPGDYDTWAALGTAYVERARVTADPAYYPLADGALRRSLALRKADNVAALAGLGALANARHDFAAARDWAGRAIAMNPYHADAYAVLADAETQLGHPAAASAAVQRLLDLRPGLSGYARAAYDVEQRGRVGDAEAMLRQALAASVDPADIAFCRHQLGDLAWHRGDLDGAAGEYAAGLAAAPDYLPLAHGTARLAAARGEYDRALAGYAELTRRAPSAGYLVEYAELLRSLGRYDEARDALDQADASLKLLAAGGGADDLAAAQLAMARDALGAGDPAAAVRLAQREWSRRQHADVADALGWALHLAGRDKQALAYARKAVGSGAPYAGYAYHLGMIELALGDRPAAERDLARAVATNASFSPVDGPTARMALAGLSGVTS